MSLNGLVRLCCCLCAANGIFFNYKFYFNYNDQVYDWSTREQTGEKPVSGSTTAVNTPFGLYLEGTTVRLPPNAFFTSGTTDIINTYSSFSHGLFVKILPGLPGNVPREILTLASSSGLRFQMRQAQDLESASQVTFELETNFGTSATFTSSSYSQSKPHTDKWFYLSAQTFYNSSIDQSRSKICINQGSAFSANQAGQFPKDTVNNYLNGANTRAIYYDYEYVNIAPACTVGDSSKFTTVAAVGSCSYICFADGSIPCDADSYSYDEDCESCGSSCAEFGCVVNGAECYTPTCPPWDYTSSTCESCYPNSEKGTGFSCVCKAGYTTTSLHPLTCYDPACDSLATAAAANKCSACFSNSQTSGSTCVCLLNYFAASASASQLTCTGMI